MNANDLFNAVMQLDLEPIKMKLMHVESGEGWSLDKANAVEKEYRRFLCLMKMYPDESIAPLVDVDTFWHYHILDTMKYAADCEQAFGYFVHHYPYVGMRGGDDEQFRIDSGERMQSLYEATFGEAYPAADATPMEASGTAYCAGPWDKQGAQSVARGETAYCAGPWDKQGAQAAARGETAYCAGPWDKQGAQAAARGKTAYCAGPWDKPRARAAAGAGTAYCAGPWDKHANTAYCAGPWDKPHAHGAAQATTAYCAGPWKQEGARTGTSAATAYCAGPWKPATATSPLNV
ncbi:MULTISPECIES: glycine-rich domain-containing protein-like [unclassified Massilia]|uniref:glycine-rich domain-containing protein n=1 Tax=unclassified Massilia TaxID=2609279 RepID=UPI000B0D729A|nr:MULTISPECIES: glycine-rich domain-containing protein-like [unclassified Massilia]